MTDSASNAVLTDEELARAGSSSAFELLVERYETRLFHFLRQRTGSAEDAEDLTQETFAAAWRARQRYQPSRPFATWLFTIARRRAISHYRARRDTVPLDAAEAVVTADPPPAGDLWQVARAQLSEKQFAALWLMYGEGCSVKEIAGRLDLSPINTKVQLHRARRRLAGVLAPVRATQRKGVPSCSVSIIAG